MARDGAPTSIQVEPFGDAAVLAVLGDRASAALAGWAGMAATEIERRRRETPGVGRPVPAHATVLVPFDPLAIDRDAVTALVRSAVEAAVAGAPSGDHAEGDTAPIEIPVRYGGDDGPDLRNVADRLGLGPAAVIELHASARYRVLFLGFAPGFGYLGGLPQALVVPRRPTPRERVTAGSVAIAGEATAVYPRSMPGGWNLIGRTDAVLFDPTSSRPATLAAGAVVRFVPIE